MSLRHHLQQFLNKIWLCWREGYLLVEWFAPRLIFLGQNHLRSEWAVFLFPGICLQHNSVPYPLRLRGRILGLIEGISFAVGRTEAERGQGRERCETNLLCWLCWLEACAKNSLSIPSFLLFTLCLTITLNTGSQSAPAALLSHSTCITGTLLCMPNWSN